MRHLAGTRPKAASLSALLVLSVFSFPGVAPNAATGAQRRTPQDRRDEGASSSGRQVYP